MVITNQTNVLDIECICLKQTDEPTNIQTNEMANEEIYAWNVVGALCHGSVETIEW